MEDDKLRKLIIKLLESISNKRDLELIYAYIKGKIG